jgi:ribonucleotide reductase beta subunit family protein with ferritin-like domain
MKNDDMLDILRYMATPMQSSIGMQIQKRTLETPVDTYCLTMPGEAFVVRSNGKISVSGNCHVEGLTKLFMIYLEEHPRIVNDDFKKCIYEMARKVYDLEEKFIDLAFEMGDVKGLRKDEVKEYIKYLIDRRLISMGLKGNFGVKDNPCAWFDTIMSSSDHTNFFEERVVEYSKNGMSGNWSEAWG